jgi:hypothetical protein
MTHHPEDDNRTPLEALADLGYSITCTLLKDHTFNSNDMADWRIVVKGPSGEFATEYHTGVAHREWKRGCPVAPDGGNLPPDLGTPPRPYHVKGSRLCIMSAEILEKQTKPTPPDLANVLHCLLMDSSAADETFQDWCSDCGYDPDSRKALDTYLTCQDMAHNLRKIGADFDALRTILEDY